MKGKLILTGLGFVALTLINGCASTYSHYGRFEGETSSGETREFLLQWETQDAVLPFMSPASTSVYLHTQCSERVLTLSSAHRREDRDEQVACSFGSSETGGQFSEANEKDAEVPVYCGQKGKDLNMEGLPVKTGQVCAYLLGSQGQKSLFEFGSTVELTISCYPAETHRQQGDEKLNTDYLKASRVPYVVSVKQVGKGSSDDRPPVLNDRVCGD